MLSFELFEILTWTIVVIVSFIVIFLISVASIQEGKKYMIHRAHKWKKQRRKNKLRKIKERQIKAAPAHLRMLTQPEYIIHFESFILLLDKIEWPKHPESSMDEGGVEKSVSRDELEDYEEELEEAVEEEDNLYGLYIEYLQSNNYNISQSELSYVVELYQKKTSN